MSGASVDAVSVPARKNWWSRNWKWVLPTGCVTLVILVTLFVFAIGSFVFGLIKSSDVYKEAVSKAKAHPAVTSALGTPVEERWYVMGQMNVSGDRGSADLQIPIAGPKGSGTVYATGTKEFGVWKINTLMLKADNTAQPIDLLEEAQPPESPKQLER